LILEDLPKQSNTLLVGAAGELTKSLPLLADSMVAVRKQWGYSGQDQLVVREITKDIDVLNKLSDRLHKLYVEHDQWQRIDDEYVKDVEEEPKLCAEKLRDVFQRFKYDTDQVIRNIFDRWAIEVGKVVEELEYLFKSNNQDYSEIDILFMKYRNIAIVSGRFYQIDRYLINLCDTDLFPVFCRVPKWGSAARVAVRAG